MNYKKLLVILVILLVAGYIFIRERSYTPTEIVNYKQFFFEQKVKVRGILVPTQVQCLAIVTPGGGSQCPPPPEDFPWSLTDDWQYVALKMDWRGLQPLEGINYSAKGIFRGEVGNYYVLEVISIEPALDPNVP